MSILNKLTEGIIDRDLSKEGAALQSKWEKTGLLEGIGDDRERASMSRLLENQAKELLREASSMAGGDVEGFAAVAFPIVRRVFGGLLANDLVSVQPMSLPSGLIFFLDFTYTDSRLDFRAGNSLYGGGVVGQQITGGVDLSQEDADANLTSLGSNAEKSFYALNTGYGSPTGSIIITAANTDVAAATTLSAQYGPNITANPASATAISSLTETQKKELRFDPDLLAAESTDTVFIVRYTITDATWDAINKDREKIVAALDQYYTHLDFVIGGKISIDIFPKGHDKSQAAKHRREEDGDIEIVFFGDRTEYPGNDYAIVAELDRTKEEGLPSQWHAVETPHDTFKILRDLYS